MWRACPDLLVADVGHRCFESGGKVYSRLRRDELELMLSGRSLINIRNKTGPKTDPWGTPLTTGTFTNDCPSTSTCSILEFRNDEIH